MRYQVSPIATEHCDSIDTSVTVAATDDLFAAKAAAEHASYAFGAGILDRDTGALDVGFGFGVGCPDLSE